MICSFTTQSILCAQSRKPYYSREVCLVADNDIFAFQDYYYTAGQDFIYRTLLRPGSRWNKLLRSPASVDSGKTILQFRYGFKIFTPSDIVTTDPGKMDRLYAGWQFVNATVSNFPSSTSANQYQLEIGVVGKNSGMEQLQEWMHHYARFDLPRGWNYQIRNEVVVNAAYRRWKNWRLAKDFDIVSQSSIAAGTGKNEIAQEIAVRVMQFNDLSNSVFANSRLSWDNRNQGRKRPIEFFLFAATGIHYVFSNILIEGSLFKGNQTPFATPKEPWVFQTRYGLMFSKHDISYSITMYHLSSEVANGDTHTYFSLSLAVRF